MEFRLETDHMHGAGWRVVIATGNRKKGTKRVLPLTSPGYTLAQAQCFISNNCVSDYTQIIERDFESRSVAITK